MSGVDVLLALFAAFMLVRHGPRALALFRGVAPSRAMAFVSLVNVLLAAAILVAAVTGMLGRLISP